MTRSAPSRQVADAFRIEVRAERPRAQVTPIGELDIATADRIDERLEELCGAGCVDLVLDLRRLTFMDSCGLRLVLAWHARAQRNGITFRLVQGPPAVRRVFELTGTVERLSFDSAESSA